MRGRPFCFMKLVLISDTHGYFPDLPDGDILIHSGDATGNGTIRELFKFNAWLGLERQRYHTILFCPGNHDRLFEKDEGVARSLVSNATVLINQEIEILGRRFYGSPYTPAFNFWAFQLYGQREAFHCWSKIPLDTDILITHGPARGVLDADVDGQQFGCPELFKKILEAKPEIHVCGHIHAGYGQKYLDGTTFVNASICNENYEPTNLPIVIEF